MGRMLELFYAVHKLPLKYFILSRQPSSMPTENYLGLCVKSEQQELPSLELSSPGEACAIMDVDSGKVIE